MKLLQAVTGVDLESIPAEPHTAKARRFWKRHGNRKLRRTLDALLADNGREPRPPRQRIRAPRFEFIPIMGEDGVLMDNKFAVAYNR
jgi:hypothetical protein